MPDNSLVIIPTYNEKENVEALYARIKKLGIGNDTLFVEDHSPDGTAQIIEGLIERDPSVHILRRPGKLGIGSAHLDGIRWAYAHGYRSVVTMDCDFTHQPEDIGEFLRQGQNYDVVVGSRYLDPKSIADWNLFRKSLTIAGHFLTKHLLKMPYDATGAFRHYRLDRISEPLFGLVRSAGYSFFFESLYILQLNGCSIKEISIRLPARTYGHSKMTVKDAFTSVQLLVKTFFRTHFDKQAYLWTLPPGFAESNGVIEKGQEEWEQYWKAGEENKKGLYDLIAVFYRKFIIKGPLNYFIKREFPLGAQLLHAGCGGGQVDNEVVRWAKVTALDISPTALRRYAGLHRRLAVTKHGSIFNIPFPEATFDGIYNLGVMEHFTEEEIRKILDEFYRVLKPGGKILLFWPPEFGLSVNALKLAHFVLHRILKKDIKLHPDEITRVLSKDHAQRLLEGSRFRMSGYYFGLRDFFTHSVVIGEKAQAPLLLAGHSEKTFPKESRVK